MNPTHVRFWLRRYIHKYLRLPNSVADYVGYWQGNGPELGEREDIEAAWHFPSVAVLNIGPPLAGTVN